MITIEDPVTTTNFIDRFLVSANASSLLPTIIVSILFSANLIAVALPIPLPPPVIKTWTYPINPLILLDKGEELKVLATSKAKFLLISGKPIGEQIARGGPFVMNTKAEIQQAIEDYHSGTFVK